MFPRFRDDSAQDAGGWRTVYCRLVGLGLGMAEDRHGGGCQGCHAVAVGIALDASQVAQDCHGDEAAEHEEHAERTLAASAQTCETIG